MGHVPKDIIVKISRVEYIYIYNNIFHPRYLVQISRVEWNILYIYIYIYSTLDIFTMISVMYLKISL